MNAIEEIEGTLEIVKITNDITLVIDHDPFLRDAGILRFANDYEVQFDWSEDAQRIFSDIDNADPIELLTVLTQKADDEIKR